MSSTHSGGEISGVNVSVFSYGGSVSQFDIILEFGGHGANSSLGVVQRICELLKIIESRMPLQYDP